MSIVDVQVRTISCNSCDKVATFNIKDHQQAVIDNPWLSSSRVIQTGDGRNYVYCSDECEILGVATTLHNIPEKKNIVEVPDGQGTAAIQIAANAAKQAESATKALKGGKPAKLSIVK